MRDNRASSQRQRSVAAWRVNCCSWYPWWQIREHLTRLAYNAVQYRGPPRYNEARLYIEEMLVYVYKNRFLDMFPWLNFFEAYLMFIGSNCMLIFCPELTASVQQFYERITINIVNFQNSQSIHFQTALKISTLSPM